MRAVLQRVTSASVRVEEELVGAIGHGLCVLVGVGRDDDAGAARRMAEKLWHLRIFEDDTGKMNRSAGELGLAILVVSQFTLYADTTRGRRPSFTGAAAPEQAEPLVEELVRRLEAQGATVQTGRFRAHMTLSITNDGPVTIVLEA